MTDIILPNLSSTFTNFSESMYSATDVFNKTCELNQYRLVQETAKLPKLAFYFALATFVALFIHFVIIPFFKRLAWYDYVENAFVGFAFATSIWTPLILMYFTFDLSRGGWKTVEYCLLGFVLVIVGVAGYFWRHEIWKLIKGLRA